MELVNEAYRLKDGLYGTPEGDAVVRFATATAASLIFPFAPHLGAEVYEALEGERVWEAPGRRPTRRCCEATRSPSSSRSTASAATRSRRPRAPPRRSSCASPARPTASSATSTAARSSRRSSCPASSSTWSCGSAPAGPVAGSARKRGVLVRRFDEAAVVDVHRLSSHLLMDAGDLGSRNCSVTLARGPGRARPRSCARTRRPSRSTSSSRAPARCRRPATPRPRRGRPGADPARHRPRRRQRRRRRLALVSVQSPAVSADELYSRRLATQAAGYDDEDYE